MEIQGSREISTRNRRSRSGSVGYSHTRQEQDGAVQYSRVRYSTIQCCTLQHNVDQCNTELYSTVH